MNSVDSLRYERVFFPAASETYPTKFHSVHTRSKIREWLGWGVPTGGNALLGRKSKIVAGATFKPTAFLRKSLHGGFLAKTNNANTNSTKSEDQVMIPTPLSTHHEQCPGLRATPMRAANTLSSHPLRSPNPRTHLPNPPPNPKLPLQLLDSPRIYSKFSDSSMQRKRVSSLADIFAKYLP